MQCNTLIPGSINQQFELDMKSHTDYARAIFKTSPQIETPNSTYAPAVDLGPNPTTQDVNAVSKFVHINQKHAKLDELNAGAGGNTLASTCDIILFGIREIKLVLCTVADKANASLPKSML